MKKGTRKIRSNAKTNANDDEIENYGRKNSTEVDTKEVHTDESDEKNENTTEPRRKLNMKKNSDKCKDTEKEEKDTKLITEWMEI